MVPKSRKMEELHKLVLSRLGDPITGVKELITYEMVCTHHEIAEEDYDMKYGIHRSYWIIEYTTGLIYQSLGRMLGMFSGALSTWYADKPYAKMDYEMLIEQGKGIISRITE